MFTTVYKNTDAVITGKARSATNGGNRLTHAVVPGVAARARSSAAGRRAAPVGSSDLAQLVGHNGKVVSRGGAPGLAFSSTPAAISASTR